MLATVFTKAIRDRWIGAALTGVAMGLLFALTMLIYRDVDLSIYADLPEFFRAIANIPEGDNAGVLAYGALYETVGAIALAAFALSLGSGAIAGEERNGTLGLLLGNPKSRTNVLLSKLAAMVILVGVGALLIWAAGAVTPGILGVDASSVHGGALVLHMYVNALFYGALAAMIGAWTGNASVATGATAGVLAVSFLASGILPMVDGLSGWVGIFPWHYYSGSQPLNNGVSWGDLALLGGLAALFAAASVAGLARRDLKTRNAAVGLIGRLRTNPLLKRILERVSGTARVSGIWVKTVSDHQGFIVIVAAIMFGMALMIGPIYILIDDAIILLAEQLPDAMLALAGGGDISTAEGYYQLEVFSLMGPIAIITVTAAMGSRALAGEEQRGTMGLLLANPIRRSRIVWEKSLAMVVAAFIAGAAVFAGTALGSLLAGLGMDIGNIAATAFLLTLLGLVFGALALALGALTGRPRIAVFGAAGAALVFYVMNAFLPLSESLAEIAKASPFYYFLSGDPLIEGLDWVHAAILAALALLLVGFSAFAFERRDIVK